jgi:hypothetical protein
LKVRREKAYPNIGAKNITSAVVDIDMIIEFNIPLRINLAALIPAPPLNPSPVTRTFLYASKVGWRGIQ